MKKILLTIIMCFVFVGFTGAETETLTLITAKEGAIEDPRADLYEIGRAYNNGPDIRIITPKSNNEYKSPLKITIQFIPVEGKEVDLSKFRVEYLKLIAIDLTDRVLPYTTKDGVKVEKADLPTGKHKLRITVGDKKGGITQEVFIVKLL